MEEQKIFTLDDEDYYAAGSLMEFIIWYHRNMEPIEEPEQLQGIAMYDPEDACSWTTDDITPEDVKEMERAEQMGFNCTGNLLRIEGIIHKQHRYAEFIDEEAKEPYLIATKNDY